MLDFFDGFTRIQLIVDEPEQGLWNRWARDRMELYRRLEPNAAPRDEAPPRDIPASHRIQLSPLVSQAIWELVLGNYEASALRHIQDVAKQSIM